MSDSKISWTDTTWETLLGCTKVSPGCTNCYAANLIGSRFAKNPVFGDTYKGLTVKQRNTHRYNWTGEIREVPANLWQPFHWKTPRKVFVNSRSDTFHRDVSFQYQCAMLAVMAAHPQHTFQILTKRTDEMKDFFKGVEMEEYRARIMDDAAQRAWYDAEHKERDAIEAKGIWQALKTALYNYNIPAKLKARVEQIDTIRWPLPNVWLGTSVENQSAARERLNDLVETPAVLRFVSVEPLLEEVTLLPWMAPVVCTGCHWYGWTDRGEDEGGLRWVYPETTDEETGEVIPADEGADEDTPEEGEGVCPECFASDNSGTLCGNDEEDQPQIHWVIVGGESGAARRPMEMAWARKLRTECQWADVAFYYKQGNGARSNEAPYLIEEDGTHTAIQEVPLGRSVHYHEGTWNHRNMAGVEPVVAELPLPVCCLDKPECQGMCPGCGSHVVLQDGWLICATIVYPWMYRRENPCHYRQWSKP